MRSVLAAILCLALAACGLAPTGPGAPPPTPWEPVDPAPVEPADPVAPGEDAPAFGRVVVGMARGDAEALLGQPTENPPENPDEPGDVVRYEVTEDGRPVAWRIIYKGGRVARIVREPLVVVE